MTGPLISAEELGSLLGSLTVLDVRYRTSGPSGPDEFAAGHVPGAVYVDLATDLAGPPGDGGRHPLPDPELFQSAMRRVGVSGDRPVVVYDDWEAQAAGRAWWLLRFHGHPDVRVLDGGLAAWVAAGGTLDTGVPIGPTGEATRPGDFTIPDDAAGRLPVVEAEEVPGVRVLVDARAAERYRGETEPIDPVAGRIPGAVNVPTSSNLTPDGRFRSAAQLRELYAGVGATPEAGERGEVAAYCGSGVTAAHDVLAMEVAGIRSALYPGSWSGWITDPSRPVELTRP